MLASDQDLLAALDRLDAVCAELDVNPRDLIAAFRESHAPVREINYTGLLGITEAARMLGTTVAALRNAVRDRCWTPETPAPVFTRSPRGALWTRTQIDKVARAKIDRDAAAATVRARKPKPPKPPQSYPRVTTDWTQGVAT